jgi:AcrR family transcriptional regulator
MRKNKKNDIIAATVSLVAQQGVDGTSIRQIAENAGVTEGALYRHFIGKEDLCQQAYCQVVKEMISAKEKISRSRKSIRSKFREWVKVSYEYFDRFPDAFTYVVLIPHDFPEGLDPVTSRQSSLLTEIVAQLPSVPDPAMSSVEVAVCHFTGVMLNVPRLINEGALEGPASRYTDEVVGAIWRIFKLER